MSDANIHFPMILAWAAPVFVMMLSLEWILVSKGKIKGRYERKDALASITLGFGNLLSDVLMGAVSLGILMWLWQFRFFDWGVSLPIIIICLFAQDFIYYCKHRAAHRIRWFWTAHVVHHSSTNYNLATALRQPWNNHFTGFVLLTSPLIFLGFHPLLVGFVGGVNLIYQYWIHTEAVDKMPAWFEAMVKNYETFNPIKIAVLEIIAVFKDVFQKGPSLWQRFKYLALPPGYSHDGSRQNSADIKREYVEQNPHMSGRPGLPDLPLTEAAE